MGEVRKFPSKISILLHPKQISVVSKKWQKKNQPFAHFLTISPSILSFPTSPFTISLLFPPHFPPFPCLFSLSSSFSLSLPFFPSSLPCSSFPLPSKISPQTFQGWATCPPCPPLVTPLLMLLNLFNPDIDCALFSVPFKLMGQTKICNRFGSLFCWINISYRCWLFSIFGNSGKDATHGNIHFVVFEHKIEFPVVWI